MKHLIQLTAGLLMAAGLTARAAEGDILLTQRDASNRSQPITINGITNAGKPLGFNASTGVFEAQTTSLLTTLNLGAAGVSVTNDGDGAISFTGLGNGSDENLTINLDDTANTAVWSSTTGLNLLSFGSIGLSSSGTYTFSGSGTIQSPVFDDDNGDPALDIRVGGSGTAVNYFRIGAAEAGLPPELLAVGSDTDIDLKLTPKGAGSIVLNGPATVTTLNATTTNLGALVFEGATADAFETTVVVADPTADRDFNIPNATTFVPVIPQLITVTGPTVARTWTVPDANFTAARTDAGQTFTGTQAFGALTATSVTNSGLTSGRVPIASTGGLMADDSDMTFATDTLTVTKVAAAVNGTVGATTPNTGAFTTLTTSGAYTLQENSSIALDPAGSADGKYSGTTITGTGGATIAFGDLVTLDKDDSRWELVDVSVAAAATGDARGIMGIAVTSSTDGTAITVLLNGGVRADANFPALTIGAAVYATTTGDITSTQPTTTDHVIRIIGYALTADEIYFAPSGTWTTHN